MLLTLSVMPSQAQDSEKLQTLLADLQTFRADVRQLVMESSGSILEESHILFMLQRPDGFYWETLEPFPELIVTDGQWLWNYQPDLLQLTIDDWDSDQSELAAQLLSGRVDEVAEQYSINAVPIADGGMEFVLQPLDPASLYQQVTLYFEGGEPESILLVNTNGQRTFWEFNNRQVNLALAPQQFVFQTPDDEMLEVIDNRSTDSGGNP
ncbi:outer membrane lipoprotein chaperone LolA [Pseudohongiella spirulinae]|uniref:outer membrane lipoprotein chaperone LolA n=1 Tax=Pseudohongiella spirulinae TaxID=1249552 RepID=UPI0014703568|nr:outer membrane lipoprotein chaperone LolA [Pseudohongiella spirulinae]